MTARLSLAMIVKDEEESLDRVLGQAAAFCDELVVADTGSTDRSREIAVAAGARVVDVPWTDDFAAARNASFAPCTGDWILWLDADDSVPEEVQQRFRQAKDDLLTDELDAVWTPYRYHFSPETGQCTLVVPRERMVRRAAGLQWTGRVHEVLTVPLDRSVARDDLYVEHRPHPAKNERKTGRNLRILQSAVASGDRSPRTLYYFANELWDNGRPEEALVAYEDFLASPGDGWERYAALASMSRCASGLGRWEQAREYGLRAIALDPSRAEAFLAVGDLYFAREDWVGGAPFFAAATVARMPSIGFISDADYSWRPSDQLSICLANSGRHEQAVQEAMRSLRDGNPERERVRSNIKWCIDQLG